MKIYEGRRHDGRASVMVVDGDRVAPLPWRLDLIKHSPTGLEWGYGGSGPAQLALAILADAIDNDTARELHQQFKARVISCLERANGWSLTEAQVHYIAEGLRVEKTAGKGPSPFVHWRPDHGDAGL
jgi:hypothetical protein